MQLDLIRFSLIAGHIVIPSMTWPHRVIAHRRNVKCVKLPERYVIFLRNDMNNFMALALSALLLVWLRGPQPYSMNDFVWAALYAAWIIQLV